MPAYALALLLLVAAPHTATATATATYTPRPTATATYTPAPTQTQRPAATAVPATPTRVPSPTPSPYPAGGYTPAGTQQFCMSLPVIGNWCPDPGALIAGVFTGVLGHLWAWIASLFSGLMGASPSGAPAPHVAPHAVAHAGQALAPLAAPRPTPTPINTGPAIAQGNGLVSHVLDVVMLEPDFTSLGFGPLNLLFADISRLGQELLAALLFLGAMRTAVRSATGGVRVWLSYAMQVVAVLFYLAALSWALGTLATGLGHMVAHVNAGSLSGFAALLVGLLIPQLGVGTPLDGAGYVFQVVLLVTMAALFVFVAIRLLLVRIGALFVQALLYAVAPLIVPTLLDESTRGIGMQWLRTYLALSLYPFFAALELSVVDKLVFGFASDSAFSDPVTRGALAIVGLAVLQTALSLTMSLCGGIGTARFGVPAWARGKGG
jgi:hypothetical protein